MSILKQSSQLLPLDSTSKQHLNHEYSVNSNKSNIQLLNNNEQQPEIYLLLSKITQLEKNFSVIQKQYQKKIKQLKDQLNQKNKCQFIMNQQLLELEKQYEEHRRQIDFIAQEIKRSLQDNIAGERQKVMSKSPQQQQGSGKPMSPKRIIRKSVEIDKKQIGQNYKNQFGLNKNDNNLTQKNNHKQQITNQQMLNLYNSKTNQQTSIGMNRSKQQKQRKKIFSPTNNNPTGPSPKRKMNFVSNKQPDLFSKPVQNKQNTSISGLNVNMNMNNTVFASRKLNNSPLQKKIDKFNGEINDKSYQIIEKFMKNDEKSNNQMINQHITNQGNKKEIFSPKNKQTASRKISPINRLLMKKMSQNSNNYMNIQQQKPQQKIALNINNTNVLQNIKSKNMKSPILGQSTKLLKFSPLNRELKSFSPKNQNITLKKEKEIIQAKNQPEKMTKLVSFRQKVNINKLFQ